MRKRERALVRAWLAMAGILLVILTILIGSRGGLVAGIFSFAVGYAMVAGSWFSANRSRSPSSSKAASSRYGRWFLYAPPALFGILVGIRSEEHTSELQSLMRLSYAVFCLKKKTNKT